MGKGTPLKHMSDYKFLFDENLSSKICPIARRRGLWAMHVNELGLMGAPDWQLIREIRSGDWTFVTNNGKDFLELLKKENIHAGLIIIVPSVPVLQQRRLFRIILNNILSHPDLINKVVKISSNEHVTIEDWPR
jgi:predicted nuclease of predicted toxin-antitoxin system